MATKILFNILGTFFVAVGILGIFLPLLPATPFLLLASACYVRGSDRLHAKLMGSVLGPYIRNFKERRGMPMRAKIVTIVILWISLLASAYRLEAPAIRISLMVIGAGVTLIILRIKTLVEEPGQS